MGWVRPGGHVSRPRWALLTALALLPVTGLSTGTTAHAAAATDDRMRAVNVVPPGQSGSFNLATFAAVQAGASSSYGPNFADQLPMYRDWKYKPFQFSQTGTGAHPGGRSDVTVYRDSYGVPQIYADSEVAMTYALGYEMAKDRLFQMEAFRRVGHGTLAEITGAASIPMDVATRRVSEGSAARLAELAAAPQYVQDEANSFTAGINQLITEECGPSVAGKRLMAVVTAFASTCPAEFLLLNDPPADWSNDDTLAFGEYAARNFGEFDVGELSNAKAYVDMVSHLGSQAAAEKAFNELYPINVPESPHIIPDADGTFPRHTGAPAPAQPGFNGSTYVNHDPSLLPPAATLGVAAAAVDAKELLVRNLQRQLGIPRWGSNAIVISGTRTADHNPILYSGPQTGWAVPGFFWEVEVHDPVRDTKGVTVPTIPLLVIGRNHDMGWSVTSALGANASTFVEQLVNNDTQYEYNGAAVNFADKHTEPVNCNNPPTVLTGGLPPQLCPLTPTMVTVYRTVHGPALADPVNHQLFTRETTVDHRFVRTLMAWDDISKTHTAKDFGAALSGLYLGFNFFYADAHGDIAYFHTGRYPIWASNIDPALPQPGTGAYDWRGEEAWTDNPHVINPSTGFLVNWNNKPARDWWTPSNIGASNWGASQQAQQLADITGSRSDWTFDDVGQIPRQVAYTDHRARALNPYLVAALQSVPALQPLAGAQAAYDLQRSDRGGGNMGPQTTLFDRWLDHLSSDVFLPILGGDCAAYLNYTVATSPPYAAADTRPFCDANPAHNLSVDNESAHAHKFDTNFEDVLLRSFRGETSGPINQFDIWATDGGSAHAAAVKAAQEAVDELTSSQGPDASKWHEPAEYESFSPQGAGSVPDVRPLQNRGSYGQVIEPLTQVAAATTAPVGLPGTATAMPLQLLVVPGLLVLVGLLRRRTRRAR